MKLPMQAAAIRDREPTYKELLIETLPARIDTEEQYDSIRSRLSELMGRKRTDTETKFLRLLSVLIKDYDERHALPEDESTPAEMLQFLLEHSGKTSADLLPIFHQRSHVSEVLNGKRRIGLEQARRLGKMFRVKAALFLG
jgi:HTH-type transcriptional regulator/antitoxin HigA